MGISDPDIRPQRTDYSAVRGLPRSTFVLALLELCGACGARHNEEERQAYAEQNDVLRDETCGYCYDDAEYGWSLVDCYAAEKGVEFMEPTLWNFHREPNGDGGYLADQLYVYDDESGGNRTPAEGWEPQAEKANFCVKKRDEDGDGKVDTDNFAFHLRGGPFIGYGGGMGSQLSRLLAACDSTDSSAEYCNTDEAFTPHQTYTFDLSNWDGVSFWARRGVNSQVAIRAMASDYHTDDDLSYIATYHELQELEERTERHCERLRECGCRNHKPCTWHAGSSKYICWNPETDPTPGDTVSTNTINGHAVDDYQLCGQSECDATYPAFEGQDPYNGIDPEFRGRPCTEYTFASGRTGQYCFDPKTDDPPPEPSRQCGDHWYAPVALSTEWRFFKIPFADLLQEGWAKKFTKLDLGHMTLVRFTWDQGWIDYWIDNLRIYRKKKN